MKDCSENCFERVVSFLSCLGKDNCNGHSFCYVVMETEMHFLQWKLTLSFVPY